MLKLINLTFSDFIYIVSAHSILYFDDTLYLERVMVLRTLLVSKGEKRKRRSRISGDRKET